MNDTTSEGERAIPKITRDDEAAGSGDLVRENVERLKALFPQIVTDGKVDFDVLRQLLGDEVEEGEERYGLNWKGKRRARAFAMTPSLGTLRPAPEDSVDWDTTQNLMIEGDNLEVLKLLRRAYAGKVKLIYIDPPYNTGGDFVYPDDYSNSIKNYLELSGQTSDSNVRLSTNKEAGGRFHTDWLSMMLPRIIIARELLKESGMLMLSCDAVEAGNMRLLLDEIFGSENYIEQFIWKKSYGGGAKEKFAVTQHEYIFAYAKNANSLGILEVDQDPEKIKQYYIHEDEYVKSRGPFRLKPLEATKSMDERENLVFPIAAPDGTEIWPKRQWWWSRERVERVRLSGGLFFAKRDDEWGVSYKQYLIDENGVQRRANTKAQ
ncbi:MAG: site-specific DNA-methyltransferase [Erythrobacter sp.]